MSLLPSDWSLALHRPSRSCSDCTVGSAEARTVGGAANSLGLIALGRLDRLPNRERIRLQFASLSLALSRLPLLPRGLQPSRHTRKAATLNNRTKAKDKARALQQAEEQARTSRGIGPQRRKKQKRTEAQPRFKRI